MSLNREKVPASIQLDGLNLSGGSRFPGDFTYILRPFNQNGSRFVRSDGTVSLYEANKPRTQLVTVESKIVEQSVVKIGDHLVPSGVCEYKRMSDKQGIYTIITLHPVINPHISANLESCSSDTKTWLEQELSNPPVVSIYLYDSNVAIGYWQGKHLLWYETDGEPTNNLDTTAYHEVHEAEGIKTIEILLFTVDDYGDVYKVIGGVSFPTVTPQLEEVLNDLDPSKYTYAKLSQIIEPFIALRKFSILGVPF